MKRSTLRAGLAWFALCSGLAGCEPTHRQSVRPSKSPDDPTSWSASPVSKGEEGSDSSKSFLKASRLQGGWSPEANEVERSLGVR